MAVERATAPGEMLLLLSGERGVVSCRGGMFSAVGVVSPKFLQLLDQVLVFFFMLSFDAFVMR